MTWSADGSSAEAHPREPNSVCMEVLEARRVMWSADGSLAEAHLREPNSVCVGEQLAARWVTQPHAGE